MDSSCISSIVTEAKSLKFWQTLNSRFCKRARALSKRGLEIGSHLLFLENNDEGGICFFFPID